MNLWLCADESAGTQTLRSLQKGPHRVRGVMCSRPSNDGVSLWKIATNAGIPTFDAQLVRDAAFADELAKAEVDVLLNVHSLHIVNAALLQSPSIGAFNLHPGKLPEFAGLDSASHAIFEGAPSHAVALHWMEAGIDTGDVAFASEWPATPADTALSVNTRCVKEGLVLIEWLLDACAERTVPRHPQDLTRRRYFRRKAPGGGVLRFSEPAARVEALVRACDFHPLASPFGHPRARLAGRSFEVVKAVNTGARGPSSPGTISLPGDRRVLVACSDAWVELKLLRVDGRFVDAASFLSDGARLDDGA